MKFVLNSFIQYQMWPNSKGKDENMMIFRRDVIKGLHGGRSHRKDGRYQEPVLAGTKLGINQVILMLKSVEKLMLSKFVKKNKKGVEGKGLMLLKNFWA